MEVEHMFSLLNKRFRMGKHRARMCKFLNSLPQFFRTLALGFSKLSYPIENGRLKSRDFAVSGHRIASLIRQPVLIRIRSRKD
jgi:hypothetical protein